MATLARRLEKFIGCKRALPLNVLLVDPRQGLRSVGNLRSPNGDHDNPGTRPGSR